MVSQDCLFIPQFIQEIPNFKTWVKGCLKDRLEILVGHIDMCICFVFLLIMLCGLLCNTRCPLLMPSRVLKMDLPFDCSKWMIKVILSCPKDFWILFLFILYGGMVPPSTLIRKTISTMGFLNMWSFGRWGCARMKPMLESLVPMWLIGKTSLNCC